MSRFRAALLFAAFTGLLLLCAAPTTITDASLRYAAVSAVLLAMVLVIGAVAARPRPAARPAPATDLA